MWHNVVEHGMTKGDLPSSEGLKSSVWYCEPWHFTISVISQIWSKWEGFTLVWDLPQAQVLPNQYTRQKIKYQEARLLSDARKFFQVKSSTTPMPAHQKLWFQITWIYMVLPMITALIRGLTQMTRWGTCCKIRHGTLPWWHQKLEE